MKKNKLLAVLFSLALIFMFTMYSFAASISESTAKVSGSQIVVSISEPIDKVKLSTLDFSTTFDKANLIFDRAEASGEVKCSAVEGDGAVRVALVWTNASPSEKDVVKLYFNVKSGNAAADLGFNTTVNKATNIKNEEIAYEIKTSSTAIKAGLVPSTKAASENSVSGSANSSSSDIKKSGKKLKSSGIPKTAGKYIGFGAAFLVGATAAVITTGIALKKRKDAE